MSAGAKLKVVYNEDHSTDVLHTRGAPVLCKDCRFAGWLTEYEFKNNKLPTTCMFYSGGADPQDGDRVKLDDVTAALNTYGSGSRDRKVIDSWRKVYTLCDAKNQDGQCSDYLRARKQSWFARLFQKRRAIRP